MKVYFETEDGEGFHHCKDACDIDWVGAQDCAEQFYRDHDGLYRHGGGNDKAILG